MKTIIAALLFAAPAFLAAQPGSVPARESVNRPGIYAGMGVHVVYEPSVVDYLNSISQSAAAVGGAATAVEFFAGGEMPVSPSWAVKAEYALLFKSYTLDATILGRTDLRYDVHAPTLMAQYVMPGNGYFIKFGAGGGYHWGTVQVTTSVYGQETVYSAHGIGGRVEAEGQTAFDEHLFGYISASAGFEAMGRATSDAGGALSTGDGSVRLNLMTAGIRFGLMYYF